MTTNTETLTLTEFLLARIAEDEVAARDALAYQRAFQEVKPPEWAVTYAWAILFNDPGMGGMHQLQPGAPTPARVLAECEAKRRIVERCAAVDFAMPSTHLAHGMLAELAAVYADHEDYRQEWRP